MKFSVGDKVLLKQTDEEGIVTDIISDEMIEVAVGGTTFPAHVDELDHPYLKWFTQKKKNNKHIPEQLPLEKPKERLAKLSKGVYISFIPQFKIEEMEDIVDHLKVYVINELPKNIQFQYEVNLKGEIIFKHEGKLHDFSNVYLHSIAYDDMNDQPRFNWNVDDLEDATMKPESGQLRIRPKALFQHIDNLLSNNEPSFNYILFEDFKPQEKITLYQTEKKKEREKEIKKKQESLEPRSEIDLHIENLIDSTRGMTNTDIIHLQLSTLQTYLRLAINSHMERLTIIHGLGKGKLKEQVHLVLEDTPEVKSYSNDWHGRYGFGATEVVFEY